MREKMMQLAAGLGRACDRFARDVQTVMGVDKLLHILVCAVLCAVLKTFVGVVPAVAVTFVVAVVKEAADRLRGERFDLDDLGADVFGMIIGAM